MRPRISLISILLTIVCLAPATTVHAEPVTYDDYVAAHMQAISDEIKRSPRGRTSNAYQSDFARAGIAHTANYRTYYGFSNFTAGRFATAGRTYDLRCLTRMRCWLRGDGESLWTPLPGASVFSAAGTVPSPSLGFQKTADAVSWDITGSTFTEVYELVDPPVTLLTQYTYARSGTTDRNVKTAADGQVLYDSTLLKTYAKPLKVKAPTNVSPASDVCFRLWFDTGEWFVGRVTPSGDCQPNTP